MHDMACAIRIRRGSHELKNIEIIRFIENFGYPYSVYAALDHQGYIHPTGYPVEIIPAHGVYPEAPPHGFNKISTKNEALLERHKLAVCHHVNPKLPLHRDPQLHQPPHKSFSPMDWMKAPSLWQHLSISGKLSYNSRRLGIA